MKTETLIDFGRRLKEARGRLNINQKQFAEKLGVTGSYVSEIENGKAKPGFDFFIKLSRTFDINPTWLLLGKGERFLKKDPDYDPLEREPATYEERLKEFYFFFEHSELFRLNALSTSVRFLIENRDWLVGEIKKKLAEPSTPES